MVRNLRTLFLMLSIPLAVGISGCSIAASLKGKKPKTVVSSPDQTLTLNVLNLPASSTVFTELDSNLKVEVRDSSGILLTTPVVVVAEIDQDPTGLAELYGDLEITTVAGVADFSQLAIDLPGVGYKLKFSIAASAEVVTDPFDVVSASVTVAPFFPVNGVNFMDYVPRDLTKRIHEQVDQVAVASTQNFHGGEVKKILLPEFAECAGLSIEETLGVFNWFCDEAGTETFFYSRGFKENKGLRDLLNSNSFKSNQIVIKKSSLTIAESTLSNTWWTNPVSPVTLNSGAADPILTLNTSGTIYTVSASGASRGIQLASAKVGLVTLGASTVISNTATLASMDCESNNVGVQATCFIVGGAEAVWLEVKVNFSLGLRAVYLGTGSSSFNAAPNIRLHNSDITSTHASSYATYSQAGYLKVTDTKFTTAGIAGIRHNNGYYSIFDNVSTSGGSIAGIYSSTSAWYSYMNRVQAENSAGRGLYLTGYFKTVLNSKSSNNGGQGITLSTSESSTIQNSLINNNGTIGIEISSTYSDFVSGNVIANNAGTGLSIISSDNVFGGDSRVENNIISNNDNGVVLLNSDVWRFSNNIIRENNIGLIISGNTTDSIWSNKLLLDNNTSNCMVTSTGANPGLVNGTCDNQGPSTATKITNEDTSEYWIAIVSDTLNTHATGSAVANVITDWKRFESRFRNWIKSIPDQIGRCTGTNTCEIFDFTLTTSAAEALFANGTPTNGNTCPASIHGSQYQVIYFSHSLLNAMEIFGDFIGNDNGFCESNEACIYKPHIGPYQGDEAANLSSCEFVDDTNLTDITVYYHP